MKKVAIKPDLEILVEKFSEENCWNGNFTMAVDTILRAGLDVLNRVYEETDKRGGDK